MDKTSKAFIAGLGVASAIFVTGYLLVHRSTPPPGPTTPLQQNVDEPDDRPEPERIPPPPREAPSSRVIDDPKDGLPLAAFLIGVVSPGDLADLSVHRGADASSPSVGELPTGQAVQFLDRRGDFKRVAWKDSSGSRHEGWILWYSSAGAPLPAGQPPSALHGVVRFTGAPPVMKVPAKRKDAEVCKDKSLAANAVLVQNGKLQDVLVRISNGTFPRSRSARGPVILDQRDCVYSPRIQGAVLGQPIQIRNEDGTLHNVHGYCRTESQWNRAQVKGSAPIDLPLGCEGIFKITCDIHPWMRAFVVAGDDPHFAVTDPSGAFTLPDVPPGTYVVEAWHSQYGLKVKGNVRVRAGETAELSFTYDGTEPAPEENKDELQGLF